MNHLNESERRSLWHTRHIQARFIPLDTANIPRTKTKTDHISTTPAKPFARRDDDAVQSAHKSLREDGFVIFSSALSTDECEKALHLAWDYVEAASRAEESMRLSCKQSEVATPNASQGQHRPVNRHNYITHTSPLWPRCVEGGILPFYGAGQSSFGWYLRSLPIIVYIFSSLYKVASRQDIISSMDGLILWRATHETERGWFHIDQNPISKPGFECYQGLVNLLPVTDQTGGNVIIAKSHLKFPQHYLGDWNERFYLKRLLEIKGDDWMEIHSKDNELIKAQDVICCALQPGDVLIWDSRLVHCSCPGTGIGKRTEEYEPPSKNCAFMGAHNLIRAAGLVSMMPKSRVSAEVLHLRKKAVDQGRTLTHWADKVAPLGAERGEEMKKEEYCVKWIRKHFPHVILSYDDLTSDQRNLVG